MRTIHERLKHAPNACLACSGKLKEVRRSDDQLTYYRIYQCEKCQDVYLAYERTDTRLQRYRTNLFEILGGNRCTCDGRDCWHNGECNISEIRCLQFDHIRGEGYTFRFGKDTITRRKYELYTTKPEMAKQELRVLCANCNWTKRVREKECSRLRKKELRAGLTVK